MDIQVLNEIASLARQASFPKVGVPVSANAQLKGLKGNPVPAPGNLAPPLLGDPPEQIQPPVTPDISSVARAASAYSVAVGDGLNSDELNAIQDLSGKIRTAVSDFLSQPGLAQAENAATVVASNPEAVQDFTSSVERAVVATLNLPEIEGEVIVNATPPNADLLEEIPAPEKFISVERITNGAEPNNPAQTVAASPAVQNAQASEHARVETPVSRPDAVASSQQEPVVRPEVAATHTQETQVTAASPAVQNSNAQNAVVENPANGVKAPEASNRDFTVTVASPAVQNAQAREHARVETPVSRPDVVASSQQKPIDRPEVVATHTQEAPVTAASLALQNAQASEHARVETPVIRPDAVASSQQEPVVRPEVVATHTQETPVTAASPAVQNSNAQSAVVENPANGVKTPEASSRDFTVTAASPAVQNAQASEHARVETPVIRPDVVSSGNQQPSVTTSSPVLPTNGRSQYTEAENPVNIPAPSVNLGQGSAGAQAQTANPEGITIPVERERSHVASASSNPQPVSSSQSRPAQASDLFAQDNAAVKPENIRNVSELVGSVVGNELASEAKKIFSEPKVIRTVADLADFILERLREIIAAQQQQSQSSNELKLS